jgi:signal transduction histidine kinase
METSASYAAGGSGQRPPQPPLESGEAAHVIARHLTAHQQEMKRIASELDAIRSLKDSLGTLRQEAYASVRDLTAPSRTLESAWAEVAVGLAANRHPDVPLDAATTALITDLLDQALTNIAQHAGASETNLSVKVEDRWIFVSVFDDGRGGAVVRPGHALAELQGRVNAMQGHFSISSPADRGTLLTVALPVAAVAEGETPAKEEVR